jgi:hypothetical protein
MTHSELALSHGASTSVVVVVANHESKYVKRDVPLVVLVSCQLRKCQAEAPS